MVRPIRPLLIAGLALVLLLPAGFRPATGQSLTDMEVRLQQLEATISDLRGQIEQLQFENRQLQDRLDRALNDIEFRLQTLEGGDPSATSSAPSGGSATGSGTGTGAGQSGAPQQIITGGSVNPNAPSGAGSGGQISTEGSLGTLSVQPNSSGSAASGSAAGTPEAAYNDAYAMIQRQDYAGAERGFLTFLNSYPNHPLASNARYWLGESYAARGQLDAAVQSFARSYQDYPNGNKAMDSLFRLGMVLGQMGDSATACQAFRQLQIQFPAAPAQVLNRVQQEQARLGC